MRLRLLVAVLLVVSAAGCRNSNTGPGGDDPPPAPEPVLCPLTGELAPEGFDEDLPAVAVKVDNSTGARPQIGLQAADVVYEELVEGGITRFLVIFHCEQADQIAPVRSARFVDPDILLEYRPVLFGYSGAAPPVRQKIDATEGVVNLEERTHGGSYAKLPGRFAPHNLAISTAALRELSDERGAPRSGLEFDSNLDLSVETEASPGVTPSPTKPPGTSVSFSYLGTTLTRYVFDEASRTYLRFHGEVPHNSASGAQLRTVNVLVLKVAVRPGTIRDAAGNVSPEISVIGEGEAIALRDGVATTGRWRRASLGDHMTLVDADGEAIVLLPGNTWINLVPSERPVDLT